MGYCYYSDGGECSTGSQWRTPLRPARSHKNHKNGRKPVEMPAMTGFWRFLCPERVT